MKKFFKANKEIIIFLVAVVFTWRVLLLLVNFLAENILLQRHGYIGPSVWANFDGIHYLSIAQNGYFQYEQAFFPLFPLLIRFGSYLTFGSYLWAGFFLVHIFLFLWLFVFYKLILLDFSSKQAKWILIFTLAFPTGFFFGSIYTETFFLFLVVAAFYAARKEKWMLSAFFIALAGATKLIGIFLLPAILLLFYTKYKKKFFVWSNVLKATFIGIISSIGLVGYMIYLQIFYKDPLFFIHAQPAFGANRTGGTLIFLPQVLFRYIKIFLTVSFTQYDTWIALLEFSMFVGIVGILCWLLYKRTVSVAYTFFSLLAIIGPTLTGSLSSMPRYVLVAFPVLMFLGTIVSNKIKIALLIVFGFLGIILTAYFTSGYFIG